MTSAPPARSDVPGTIASVAGLTKTYGTGGAVVHALAGVDLSLAAGLVAEARALGVNVSQAAEVGIAAAVAQRRQERWLQENQAAIHSSNAYVEEHGLPLARYQAF